MKNLVFWFFLGAWLTSMVSWFDQWQERKTLEKILAQEMADHLITKELYELTIQDCAEAWLKEPVSKKWKRRFPK